MSHEHCPEVNVLLFPFIIPLLIQCLKKLWPETQWANAFKNQIRFDMQIKQKTIFSSWKEVERVTGDLNLIKIQSSISWETILRFVLFLFISCIFIVVVFIFFDFAALHFNHYTFTSWNTKTKTQTNIKKKINKEFLGKYTNERWCTFSNLIHCDVVFQLNFICIMNIDKSR